MHAGPPPAAHVAGPSIFRLQGRNKGLRSDTPFAVEARRECGKRPGTHNDAFGLDAMRPVGLADYLRCFDHPGGIVVSRERKFIYMKAPRTSGTSILRRVLQTQVPGLIHHKDAPEPFAEWRSRIDDEQLAEYYIFSFVRNPWDRFVSIACYFKLPIERLALEFDRLRQDEPLRSHSLPQYGYSHCHGIRFADSIGRFENLQSDFNRICKRIGLKPSSLPHVNRTTHEHYSRYYDLRTKEVVTNLYAQDIRTFAYQFESG